MNCKCEVWKHDIPSSFLETENLFQRMGVEEIDQPEVCDYKKAVGEGYHWLPRGWVRIGWMDGSEKHFLKFALNNS